MTRVRSYGQIVSGTETPRWAQYQNGLFVPSGPAGAVGRVVSVEACEDVALRSIYATWTVDMLEPTPPIVSTQAKQSGFVAATDVTVRLNVGVACGLTVTKEQ